MIAKWRRPGTASRKSSSRLPARSAAWDDRPVTLPPGRARLGTRPVPIGSFAAANTIGTTDVTCFAASTAHSRRYDHIDLESDELSGNLAEALGTSLRPTILDRQGATLDPAEFAQSLNKGGDPCTPGGRRSRSKEPNDRHLRWLLRARRERPCSRSTKERDEFAAFHRPMPPCFN